MTNPEYIHVVLRENGYNECGRRECAIRLVFIVPSPLHTCLSFRRGQHYVPRFLCSPVPTSCMFPEPMFPGTYVPRYLCSPIVLL